MKQKITLNNLKIGETGKIVEVKINETIYRRLLDLGFVPGALVTKELISTFKDPVAYKIKNALIALRNSDSQNIIVEVL